MDEDGLIAAFILDGKGGGTPVDWTGVGGTIPENNLLWVHLDRNSEFAQDWITNTSGVDAVIAAALLAKETRPRSFSTSSGLFVILRGINLNEGEKLHDMVSLRLWIEEHRVISVRIRSVKAVSDIADHISDGRGPSTAGGFLAHITQGLADRMEPAIQEMIDGIDQLEEDIDKIKKPSMRKDLTALRHKAIVLRRYLAPQREALSRVGTESLSWLALDEKMAIREVADRTTRYVEELDEMRERCGILQDEILNVLSMQMNQRVYVLTVLAALIVPLTLVSSLMGMNVGGLPLTESKYGFWWILGGLFGFSIFGGIVLKKLKWL